MAQEKWLIDGEKVIDLGIVRKLKVGLVAGQVNVVGHDEPTARIEVHSVHGRELKVTVDGDSVSIDHVQLRWDNFVEVFKSLRGTARADVSITVPRDVALTFGVVSASALIAGLTADASVSTVSGDVVVDGCSGSLQLNGVSGEVAVRNHAGDIQAHTVSGDLAAMGELGRFSADTVSGDVLLDITGTPDEVRINTVSGSVTTRLAPGVPAQYRVSSVSGRLQLDDAEIMAVRGRYVGKYGVLDERWLDFSADTVSGDVSVLHAVSA